MTPAERDQLGRIVDIASARGLTVNYDKRNGLRVIRQMEIGGEPGFIEAFRFDFDAAEAATLKLVKGN